MATAARARPTHGHRLVRALAGLLLGGSLLAGCGSDEDERLSQIAEIALNPCPRIGLLAPAADRIVYAEGEGVSRESIAYTLELVDAESACAAPVDGKIAAEVAVSFFVRRGPAGRDLTVVDVPLVVALVRQADRKVILREPITQTVKLGTDKDAGAIAYASIRIPLAAGTAPTDYQLVAALELTPAELADSIRRRQGR